MKVKSRKYPLTLLQPNDKKEVKPATVYDLVFI